MRNFYLLIIICVQIGIGNKKTNSGTAKKADGDSNKTSSDAAAGEEPSMESESDAKVRGNFNDGIIKDVLVHLATKDKPTASLVAQDEAPSSSDEDCTNDNSKSMLDLTETDTCMTWSSGTTFAEALKYYSVSYVL